MARTKKTSAVQLNGDLSQQIVDWQYADAQLAYWKEREHELREQITMKIAPDLLEGIVHFPLTDGFSLKCSKKQGYTLTNKQGETVSLLNAIAAHDPGAATSLVKWKPDLSIKVYKDIVQPMVRNISSLQPLLAAALTIKPSLPEIEIIAPKKE